MQAWTRRMTLAIVGTGLTIGLSIASGQPGEALAPRVPPVGGLGQGEPKFATADAMLDALERAGENLVSLTADIKYDKTSELQGDRQVRLGKLFYVSGLARAGENGQRPIAPNGDDPIRERGRRFAIRFNEQWLDGARRDEEMTYIFDGEWLVEKLPQEKPPLFLKRQVVPPGESFDPLRIGEGPFPVPIGQRKADILQRYVAELLPPGAGLEAGPEADAQERKEAERANLDVAGSHQLRLTPRPERAAEDDFTEIRLWYREDAGGVLLPRMARTISKGGDTTTVLLINTEVQVRGGPENLAAAVPESQLDVTAPADGWQVEIHPWRGQGGFAEPGQGKPGLGGE